MNYIVAFLLILALYEKRTESVSSVYKGRIPRQLSNNLPSTIDDFENITIENSTETTTSFPDDNDITDDNIQYILELFDKNKLPPSIVPKDYIINLVTDSKNLKFNGDVIIYGTTHNAIETKNVITMNADAINVTDVDVIELKTNKSIVNSFKLLSASEHLVIELNEELQSKTEYIISMNFFGEIRSENGIYFSSFYNDTTKTQSNPIIMTEFQPTYARTVFPCWDEPQYKASFIVRVARELNETALSNMPVVHTSEPDSNENGKVWDTFQKSPVMSTYLVAVVIGELGVLKDPEGSNISIWTQPGKEETGKYALNLTKSIVEVLEKFTESDYILPKLDQVALPALDFDAMENWGVISYMDSYLLVDDKDSIEQKQKVAYHVTHEVAHQWFGNLITLQWWDSVWLNEGFAQFFQYFILDSLEPEWRTMDSFVVTEIQYILDVDSNTKTHSLTEIDIDSTDDILSMFDGTSYFKGGAIVRMLYHMVTPDLFQKSIAKYIEVNKLESVTEEDLWDSFREVVSSKLDLPADISELMYNWVHKNGYPVIHVERSVNDSGPVHSVTLTQIWFLKKRDKFHLDDISELKWWIPLTYTTSTDLDFEDTKPKEWFKPTTDKHNLSIYLEEDEWFILNTQLTGFYRVNYDELTWKLIIDDMVDYGFYDIHPINRAALLDDAFNLALTGYIDIEIPMNLSRYLFRETDIIPWTTASAIFTKLAKGLTSTPARPLFMKYARSLISSCWFSEIELDENENDTIATKLNRMLLIQVACSFQHKGCQAKALNQVFLMMSEADLVIPSDLESLYLSIGVALGPDEVWQYVRKRYIKSNNKIERRMLLDAMACNDDNTILEQMLKDSIDNESFLLEQDRSYLIDGIISQMHPSELNIILKFFSENFNELLNLHGEPKVKSFFLRMAMRSNKTQTEKIHKMLLDHSDKLDTTFLLIEGKKNNDHFELKPAIYNRLYEWLQREEIDSENDNENETNDSNEDEDFDFDEIETTTDVIVVEENTTLDYDISNTTEEILSSTTEEISTTTEYLTESNELLNKIKIGRKNLTDYVHKKVDEVLENNNELLNKITPLRPTIKPDNSSGNNVKTDYLYILMLILLLYLNVLFIVNC